MHRATGLGIIVCVAAWGAIFPQPSKGDEPRAATGNSLGVLDPFDRLPVGQFQTGYLDSWRWNDTYRAEASRKSRLEVVDSGDGRHALRVVVDDPQILEREGGLSLLRLAPFYPPEGDALRIRVRVISGTARLHVGGPTAYFGNSDVFSEPQQAIAGAEPRSVDLVCNLNHPTWRNFRRSSFSTEAPRNYYHRWAQEPLGVFVSDGTQGEFLIERIELVALGEGKPFPRFEPEQVQAIAPIADFEQGGLEGTFNLYMANTEVEWFEQSWKREQPLRFEPLTLSLEKLAGGTRALACSGRTAEEVHCTGIKTTGNARANALSITLASDAPEQRNTLLGVGPIVAIDFLIFTAPTELPFPWDRFGPTESLRAFPGPGFDYHISYSAALRTHADVNFAIYHTRRYLKPEEWTTLILPTADFTCVYGQGAYRERFLDHRPLTCDDVIAVAWLRPWCRVGRGNAVVTTRIDGLSFVHVPGSPAEHRSFWQVPDVSSLTRRESRSLRGRLLHLALPGDEEPGIAPPPQQIP